MASEVVRYVSAEALASSQHHMLLCEGGTETEEEAVRAVVKRILALEPHSNWSGSEVAEFEESRAAVARVVENAPGFKCGIRCISDMLATRYQDSLI